MTTKPKRSVNLSHCERSELVSREAIQPSRGGAIPARSLFFRLGEFAVAEQLCKRWHYSGRMAGNVQVVGTLHIAGGLFGDAGNAVAAITFSIPPTRWSESVLELSRLVRTSEKIPLTLLIRLGLSAVLKKGCDLVVSFADWTQSHHGGVYQSASWNYSGMRESRMDGVTVDGEFIPGRSANSRWGTQSPKRLLQKNIQAEPHYDEGKHIYWKALAKSGESKAVRLGLASLPYPKPHEAESRAEGGAA